MGCVGALMGCVGALMGCVGALVGCGEPIYFSNNWRPLGLLFLLPGNSLDQVDAINLVDQIRELGFQRHQISYIIPSFLQYL